MLKHIWHETCLCLFCIFVNLGLRLPSSLSLVLIAGGRPKAASFIKQDSTCLGLVADASLARKQNLYLDYGKKKHAPTAKQPGSNKLLYTTVRRAFGRRHVIS